MKRPFLSLAAIVLVTLLGTGAAAVPMVDETPVPDPSPSETEEPDAVRDAQYWLGMLNIEQAWEVTRGKGVKIAIIDTGIAKGPEQFSGVVGGTDVSGRGTADGRTPVGVVDRSHGSWVASLAGARPGEDGRGMIGVAPEAELLSISVGFGSNATVPFAEQIAKAMKWAVDNGADIINLSLTTNTLSWDESWDKAFLYAFEHDVVVVVAAGNRGSGTKVVGAPATIPGVLTVAGVDPQGVASVGASTQGITIGVSAPSEQLLGVSPEGDIDLWPGTSGAAPIVAGIAALVRSAHPEMDANNVINHIIKTARKPASVDKVPDALYGFGIIDADAAVRRDIPKVDENPMGSLKQWIKLYRRAPSVPREEPTAAPVVVPPLPAREETVVADSPFLPSRDSVLYGSIPLMALTVPGILLVLGVIAAARSISSARVRPSSRDPFKENSPRA